MASDEDQPRFELALRPASAFGLVPHPLIPDANALAEDAVHYTKRQLATGNGYSRLTFLAGLGVARAFVPAHIPRKVEIRLEEVARNCRVDVDLAYENWNTVLRPQVRVVDLPPITDADDPRVLSVRAADEEDGPVAQLAVLLAPALLLTKDHHLLDAGLGVAKWADALGLVQQIFAVDGAVRGSAGLTFVGVWAAGSAARKTFEVVARSPTLIGLALGLAFMLLTDWRESTQTRLASAGAASKRVAANTLEMLANAYEHRQSADTELEALLVEPGALSMSSRVARQLAVSAPASVGEIIIALDVEPAELTALLNAGLLSEVDGQLALGRPLA